MIASLVQHGRESRRGVELRARASWPRSSWPATFQKKKVPGLREVWCRTAAAQPGKASECATLIHSSIPYSHRVRQAGAGGWSWSGVREKYCYLTAGWRLEVEE